MFRDYLKELNEAQQAAVINTDGPAMVIAGAGSGKTRVLTYRIAYLLQQGVPAHRILALTFTNKAAGEMKERIMNIVGPEKARSLWMGTFHSIFARFLRYDGHYLGYKSNFTIYDQDNTRSLIRAIIREMKLDDSVYKPASIAARISHAKNNLITAQQYGAVPQITESDKASRVPEAANIYRHYAARCFKSNAMDFDDLLMNINILFRDFPGVLEEYRNRFDYVLVDEYQDTNYAQYIIVHKLSEKHRNLCVVGDDAQSIYSFRGARIENILNFEKDYPDYRLFKLEQNYRSTKNIVNAANSVIEKNAGQIRKTIFSKNDEGEKIRVIQTTIDSEEGIVTASDIIDTRMRERLNWKDFAILYRTNAQSRIFEEMLRKRNIPYKIYGGQSFYERKEIRDLIAYLRLIVNPDDEEALRRVINYPKRGIGDTTVQKLMELARALEVSIWSVISSPELSARHLAPALRTKVSQFTGLMLPLMAVAETATAYDIASGMASASGIITELKQGQVPEEIDRLENLQELLNGIKEFTESAVTNGEPADIATWLQSVALLTDQDLEKPEDRDKVTLMTIHSAKGLEFKYVYIVGLEENLFPSAMNIFNPRELEEERRLFYVALTRACRRVTLSYALNRYKWGSLERGSPSRFIGEIESEFLSYPQTGGKPFRQRAVFEPLPGTDSGEAARPLTPPAKMTRLRDARDRQPPSAVPGPSQAPDYELEEGDRVRHERFGEGVVVSVEGEPPNTTALIDFKSTGTKKLLLRFAKLTRI
ncbi:MAG: UvrD-helicase domain-containing protein [Bacteroidales bacterium]|jgi:DNA helicase-2/ATP-dependent DNA helicase PcrA|nr:UvrD-helicase domain-containing protein [Bacteroidales bacterium]